VLAESEENFF